MICVSIPLITRSRNSLFAVIAANIGKFPKRRADTGLTASGRNMIFPRPKRRSVSASKDSICVLSAAFKKGANQYHLDNVPVFKFQFPHDRRNIFCNLPAHFRKVSSRNFVSRCAASNIIGARCLICMAPSPHLLYKIIHQVVR